MREDVRRRPIISTLPRLGSHASTCFEGSRGLSFGPVRACEEAAMQTTTNLLSPRVRSLLKSAETPEEYMLVNPSTQLVRQFSIDGTYSRPIPLFNTNRVSRFSSRDNCNHRTDAPVPPTLVLVDSTPRSSRTPAASSSSRHHKPRILQAVVGTARSASADLNRSFPPPPPLPSPTHRLTATVACCSPATSQRRQLHPKRDGRRPFDGRHATSPAALALAAVAKCGTVHFMSVVSREHPASPKVCIRDAVHSIGVNWSLDIVAWDRALDGNAFRTIGRYLLAPYAKHPLNIQLGTLDSFLTELQNTYNDLPYHNALHSSLVAHQTEFLLRTFKLKDCMSDVELVSLYVAALGHDVGHIGRSNAFCVESGHPLSLIYNDVSVMENFHCFLLFMCLMKEENQIFAKLSQSDYRGIRKRIIELILTTDMAAHLATVSYFRKRRMVDHFNMHTVELDRFLVIKLCIKMGDLGHATLDWPMHEEWSNRISKEFYSQGDEERALGLPISPVCDRMRLSRRCADQAGFLEFVVMPLVKELDEADGSGTVRHDIWRRLEENISNWKSSTKVKSNVVWSP